MTADVAASRLPSAWLVAGTASAAAVCAVLLPLATYAVTLAAFGLVHVLAELRYVDGRFSPRVPWRLGTVLLAIVGGIVLARLLGLAQVLPRRAVGWVELGLVAALAACTLPLLKRAGPRRALVGLTLVGALIAGAWYAPLATLVVLAVAHNLTPVGFLAERLSGRARRRALVGCGVLFVGVPALIVSGWPAQALTGLGLGGSGVGVLASGGLQAHLGVFVPAGWRGGPRAVDLFAAAVYLQCLHYAVVIGVLPRLAPANGRMPRLRLRWPAPRRFALLLLAAGGISLAVFAIDFRDARTLYGLVALVHAWIEVPVLLLAMALPSGA